MRLAPDAPLTDAAFRTSMHKTYTDCYRMQGFVGGDWSYTLNTNATGGNIMDRSRERLEKEQQRLAVYYLGWESIEV
jgi:hypothetical protein